MRFKDLFDAEPYSVTTCPICNQTLFRLPSGLNYECGKHANIDLFITIDDRGKVNFVKLINKNSLFAFCSDHIDPGVRFYNTKGNRNYNWDMLAVFDKDKISIKDYDTELFKTYMIFS